MRSNWVWPIPPSDPAWTPFRNLPQPNYFLHPLLLLTKFSIISWSSQAHVCPYSVWTGFPTPCMLVYVCLCSDLTIWLLNSRNFRETATYEEDHHFYWTSWYWASGPFIHLKPKIINWAITPYLNPEIPPKTDKSDGIMITFPLALPPPLSLISPRSLSLSLCAKFIRRHDSWMPFEALPV